MARLEEGFASRTLRPDGTRVPVESFEVSGELSHTGLCRSGGPLKKNPRTIPFSSQGGRKKSD